MPDQVHSLFLLHPQKSVSDVIKYSNGSSSHSINEQDLISKKFAWQTGYAACSVSESQLEKVFQYIKNLKQHHQKKTFTQEHEELMKLHGLDGKQQSQNNFLPRSLPATLHVSGFFRINECITRGLNRGPEKKRNHFRPSLNDGL
jgi:hypothetical protein